MSGRGVPSWLPKGEGGGERLESPACTPLVLRFGGGRRSLRLFLLELAWVVRTRSEELDSGRAGAGRANDGDAGPCKDDGGTIGVAGRESKVSEKANDSSAALERQGEDGRDEVGVMIGVMQGREGKFFTLKLGPLTLYIPPPSDDCDHTLDTSTIPSPTSLRRGAPTGQTVTKGFIQ